MDKVYKFHPVCNLLPQSTQEEYEKLVLDIEDRISKDLDPLIHKIVVWRGDNVICGRSRFRAMEDICKRHRGLKLENFIVELDEHDDPYQYVYSEDMVRRNLTPSQLSLVAAEYAKMKEENQVDIKASAAARRSKKKSPQKTRKQKAEDAEKASSTALDEATNGLTVGNVPKKSKSQIRDEAAEKFSISPRMVMYGEKVNAEGSENLKKAVTSGELSVVRAAEIVASCKSAEEQDAAIHSAASEPRKKPEKKPKKTPEAVLEEKRKEDDRMPEANEVTPAQRLIAIAKQMGIVDAISVLFGECDSDEKDLVRKAIGGTNPVPKSEVGGAGAVASYQPTFEGMEEAVNHKSGLPSGPRIEAKIASEDPIEVVQVAYTLSVAKIKKTILAKVKAMDAALFKDADEEFEMFWNSYPDHKRREKPNARKAWDKALAALEKRGETNFAGGWAGWLISRAADYSRSPIGKCKYAKQATSWLNAGCYDDDPSAWTEGSDPVPKQSGIYSEEDARRMAKLGKDKHRL